MDRRKRKSKQAIFDACLQLIKTKDFEAITIHEIAELADLNRGTFYLHYSDKYDMINHYEDELIGKIQQVVLSHLQEATSAQAFLASRYSTIVDLLDCLKEEQQLFRFIIQTRGSASLETKLKSLVHNVALKEIFTKLPMLEQKVPFAFFSTLFVSILLSIAQEIPSFEKTYTSEQLATTIIDILLNGPAKVTGLIEGEKIDIAPLIQLATNHR